MSVEFLKKALPSKGLYCVARAIPGKSGMIHTFHDTVEQAYYHVMANAANGHTMFVAQGSFLTNETRKGYNTDCFRSFFLDIDCGADEKYPYKNQWEGITAIKKFVADTNFPFPSIISSGNGLYAYWHIDEDMPSNKWQGIASLFKSTCNAVGFKLDHARTSDLSSILRPPGAGHFKDPQNPKIVKVINDSPQIPLSVFTGRIAEVLKKHKLKGDALLPPKQSKLNDEFSAGLDGPPAFCSVIAEKCGQVRLMRDTKGDISEPLWYALIGVLRYAQDGEQFIHEWSSGHSGYSQSETAKKIAQHPTPPTTCHYLGEINPSGCFGCKFVNKQKTPLVLGRVYADKVIEDERVEIPASFRVTDAGIMFEGEEPCRVYPYDIYPCAIAFDESAEHEIVRFRHQQPHKGWSEFSIRSALLHDIKNLLMVLHDNHVQITGMREKQLMVSFMEQYVAKLRAKQRMVKLSTQMGWKADDEHGPSFVLGGKMFVKGEPAAEIGFAKNVPEVVKAYHTQGSYDEWKAAISCLDHPDMMGHTFAFIASAFGSPLLHFSGYAGTTICCLGKSGIGKTMMGNLAQSVYGEFDKLMMRRKDTKNAIMSRMGIYGSLPMTIDEVSNMDKLELSDLIHNISQGRDKVRLGRNAVEKTVTNSWKTIAMVSSNHSLIERLASSKGDVGAELNRLVEYTMYGSQHFDSKTATALYRTISENYGHAGEEYIQYLVDNYDKHNAHIDKITEALRKKTGDMSEERFWCAIGAVTIYAAMITNKLGITKIDVLAMQEWYADEFKRMRGERVEADSSAYDIIGNFLDKFSSNLVIAHGDGRTKDFRVSRVPTNGVVGMIQETKTTRIAYINRKVLRDDLVSQSLSFNAVMNEFKHDDLRSPLFGSIRNKCLGAGIDTLPSAAVSVVAFDLNHPKFGNKAAELINNANEEFLQNRRVG